MLEHSIKDISHLAGRSFTIHPTLTYSLTNALKCCPWCVSDAPGPAHHQPDQEGERDMVLQLSLGAMADPTCQGLLTTLYPHTDPDTYTQAARSLLTDVWSSPRHHHRDGTLCSIHALCESGLLAMAGDLAPKVINAFNALNLIDTIITPADCYPIGQFLKHLPQPCSHLILNGRVDDAGLQHIANAGGFTGLICTQVLLQTHWA